MAFYGAHRGIERGLGARGSGPGARCRHQNNNESIFGHILVVLRIPRTLRHKRPSVRAYVSYIFTKRLFFNRPQKTLLKAVFLDTLFLPIVNRVC